MPNLTTPINLITGPQSVMDLTATLNNLIVQINNALATQANDTSITTDNLIVNGNPNLPISPIDAGTLIQVQGKDATVARIEMDTFGGNPLISAKRADGTYAAPSAVQLNDILLGIHAYGYGTSQYSSASRAQINYIAGEAWTNTANGAGIAFQTTATGGTTTSEKGRFAPSGNFLLGSTTDNATDVLQVTGTIYSTGNVKLLGSSTGITSIASGNTGSTNFTQTLPQVSGVVASTSGSNLCIIDTKRCTAQVDKIDTTLVNVTGLSFTVVPGTYAIYGALDTTCGGTGGVKLAFNYTTAVLSTLNVNGFAYTASAVAVSKTTTTTTQTSFVASNTAFTNVVITGTMIVTTGGTVDLQFAENSANSTSSVLVGSTMQLIRIA